MRLILVAFFSFGLMIFFPSYSFSAGVAVHVVGEQRAVMQRDDRRAKISLNELDAKSLFALGPVENLDGEITVDQGRPFIARLDGSGRILMDHRDSTRAVFLVSANVPHWGESKVSDEISSPAGLEAYLEVTAKKAELDPESAFPFLLRGSFSRVDYHIVRGADAKGVSIAGGDRVLFTEKDVKGTIVGFFSKYHQGIFTHKDRFVHMHFISDSGLTAGHVEGLHFTEATLSLPK